MGYNFGIGYGTVGDYYYGISDREVYSKIEGSSLREALGPESGTEVDFSYGK